MTDYVTRDDTNLGVGRILTSPTLYALYDNPIAIAEGAADAPRIQTAAIQDLAVTHGKLAANLRPYTLISSANITSPVATIDFPTVFSGYRAYRIEVTNLTSSATSFLWMRTTNDSGSTYNQDGSGYNRETPAFGGTFSTGTAMVVGPNQATTQVLNLTCEARVPGLGATFMPTFLTTGTLTGQSAGDQLSFSNSGSRRNNETITGFRLLMSTGNISTAYVRVYGVLV